MSRKLTGAVLVRLEPELLELLEQEATREGMSKPSVIRELLRLKLKPSPDTSVSSQEAA